MREYPLKANEKFYMEWKERNEQIERIRKEMDAAFEAGDWKKWEVLKSERTELQKKNDVLANCIVGWVYKYKEE